MTLRCRLIAINLFSSEQFPPLSELHHHPRKRRKRKLFYVKNALHARNTKILLGRHYLSYNIVMSFQIHAWLIVRSSVTCYVQTLRSSGFREQQSWTSLTKESILQCLVSPCASTATYTVRPHPWISAVRSRSGTTRKNPVRPGETSHPYKSGKRLLCPLNLSKRAALQQLHKKVPTEERTS